MTSSAARLTRREVDLLGKRLNCTYSQLHVLLCISTSRRWLQPDRAVDPEASELVLPSDPLLTGLPSYFTVTTRDQDGKRVYVGDMKVPSQLCLIMTRDHN